jgi:hypothetical protein
MGISCLLASLRAWRVLFSEYDADTLEAEIESHAQMLIDD